MSELNDIEVGEKQQPRTQPSEVRMLARYLATVDEVTWLTLGLPQLKKIVAELEQSDAK
ncbi:MAG: hypothetical protein WA869_06885 [Alloacidobacterium sp.]|jgi:hypothetical protein